MGNGGAPGRMLEPLRWLCRVYRHQLERYHAPTLSMIAAGGTIENCILRTEPGLLCDGRGQRSLRSLLCCVDVRRRLTTNGNSHEPKTILVTAVEACRAARCWGSHIVLYSPRNIIFLLLVLKPQGLGLGNLKKFLHLVGSSGLWHWVSTNYATACPQFVLI
jgi:hypothetical protein